MGPNTPGRQGKQPLYKGNNLCDFPFVSMHNKSSGWGGGWGRGVTSYILYNIVWHSMDMRAEYPPFSALPGI